MYQFLCGFVTGFDSPTKKPPRLELMEVSRIQLPPPLPALVRKEIAVTDMQLIEQLYRPELAFLPIGDLYTMSPREAAAACRLLKPKRVVPMHFGTFLTPTGRPEQLTALVDLPGTEVWTLEPGKPVEW
jgi:hypothetical protein